MQVFNYNPERKDKSNLGFIFKFILLGVLIAALFLGGLKLIVLLIQLIINYWVWSLIIVLSIIFLKILIKNRSLKNRLSQNYTSEDYY